MKGVTMEHKALKITNPLYLGHVGPQLKTFSDKLDISGMTYESLYTYFAGTIQFGKGMAEFWVVFEEDKPVGFAHWLVRGLPHISKVYCDFITTWSLSPEPNLILLKEFIKFGERNNAVWLEGDAINESIFRLFRRIATTKCNLDTFKSEHINFTARKRGPNNEDIRKDNT